MTNDAALRYLVEAETAIARAKAELTSSPGPGPAPSPAGWNRAFGPADLGKPFQVIELYQFGVPETWLDWQVEMTLRVGELRTDSPGRYKIAYLRTPGSWPFDLEYQSQKHNLVLTSDTDERAVIELPIAGSTLRLVIDQRGGELAFGATASTPGPTVRISAQPKRTGMDHALLTFGASRNDLRGKRSLPSDPIVPESARVWVETARVQGEG
jgi:hypothetical protein